MRKLIIIMIVFLFVCGYTTVSSNRKGGTSSYDIVIDSNAVSGSEVLHTKPIEGSLQWVGLVGTGADANGIDVMLVDEDGFVFYDNSSMDVNDIHVLRLSDVDGNVYGGADVSSRFTLSWSGNSYTTVRFKVHVSASN